MLDKKGYMHARTCTRLRGRAQARRRARTHAQICNMYCFSTAKMTRERASVLRYTYIACLVLHIRSLLALIYSGNCISFCRATAQL
jgi:hypothetical protein